MLYCEWQVHCNFVLYAVVLISVLMFHVKSSIQLLYAINHWLIELGGLGERCKLPSGSRRSPAAKRYLVHLGWEKLLVRAILCAYSRKNTLKFDEQFSILVDINDWYKIIVKLTSLYKLWNIKCSGFEWVNNFFRGILGGALAPSAPSCIRPWVQWACHCKKKFTFAISSPDEFLLILLNTLQLAS